MRLLKTGFPAVAFFAVAFIGPVALAPASADSAACRTVPGPAMLSETALRDKVAALGYDVWRVELDDSCYEVEARDSSGAYVELDLDPATGDLLGWERED